MLCNTRQNTATEKWVIAEEVQFFCEYKHLKLSHFMDIDIFHFRLLTKMQRNRVAIFFFSISVS